jgi:hypothetical protein
MPRRTIRLTAAIDERIDEKNKDNERESRLLPRKPKARGERRAYASAYKVIMHHARMSGVRRRRVVGFGTPCGPPSPQAGGDPQLGWNVFSRVSRTLTIPAHPYADYSVEPSQGGGRKFPPKSALSGINVHPEDLDGHIS